MKEISLTRGYTALVDDEDFEQVSGLKWHILISTDSSKYAQSCKNGERLLLHRFVMNAPPGLEVDHKNHNGLDCRKENLRLATHTQNQQNCGLRASNTSGYKGVCRTSWGNKYRAQIRFNGQKFYLGVYETAIEAARAYNDAALEMFGEFAWLNKLENEK